MEEYLDPKYQAYIDVLEASNEQPYNSKLSEACRRERNKLPPKTLQEEAEVIDSIDGCCEPGDMPNPRKDLRLIIS